MKLRKWMTENSHSTYTLASLVGIHRGKLQRIAADNVCVRLDDAHKIVKFTRGEVDYCDLMTGDC